MDQVWPLLVPVGLSLAPRGGLLSMAGIVLSVLGAVLVHPSWAARASLAPSTGLWWYFFAELFTPFASLYASLWLVLFVGSLALLCFLLRRAPMLPALACALLSASIFLPRPSLLLAVSGPLVLLVFSPGRLSGAVCAALLASLAALPLGVLMRLLWTERLSGNANFYYAATLLHAGGNLFACLNHASQLIVHQYRTDHGGC